MNAQSLLEECRRLDIHLRLEGGDIRVRTRDAGIPTQLRELLARHKPGLVNLLTAAAPMSMMTTADGDSNTGNMTKAVPPVFVDLETRSRCPIEKGGRRYAADPSTQILSVVVLADDTMIVWTPLFATPIPSGLISASISNVLPTSAAAGPLRATGSAHTSLR